ncbi:MAG: S-layer homology domain-containing protein [Clostridia bacterium]|nr:S-layer homology domain-containing protein [Clostridia bacterium]
MIKRTVSLLLLLCVCFLSFNTVDAADEYKGKMSVMDDLGLLPDNLIEDFSPSRNITRAEFVAICVELLNIGDLEVETKFTDVPESHKYYKYINRALDVKIINGSSDGLFYPDTAITTAQAATMLVRTLGYEIAAEHKGGYPLGYLQVANDMKLFKGVNTSRDYLKMADCIHLIKNAVDTSLAMPVTIGNNGITYENSGEDTVLSLYYGIKKYEGQLRANKNIQLEDVLLKSDSVLIDNKIFRTKTDISDEYVGRCIYYYVDAEDYIIEVEQGEDTEKILELNAGQIDSFEDGVYTYFDGNTEKSAKLDNIYEVSYNGRVCANLTDDEYIPQLGSIRLIDNTGNGRFDIVMIRAVEDVVIDTVNADKEIVTDKYTGKKYNFASYKSYEIIDEFGNSLPIESLDEYDVLSIIASKDGYNAKIYYSNSELYGTIEEMSLAENNPYIVICGVSFNVSNAFKNYISSFSVGDDVSVTLDIYGNVSCIRKEEERCRYAYLVAARKGNGLDDSIEIKLFTDKGEMEILSFKDKLKYNGEAMKSEHVYTALLNGESEVKAQLVRFFKSGSMVSELETVHADNNTDGLKKMYAGYDDSHKIISELKYNQYSLVFGGIIPMANNAVIFMIPKDLADEDDYAILTRQYFTHEYNYAIDAFNVKCDDLQARAMVIYGQGGGSVAVPETYKPMLVKEVSDIILPDGDISYRINGLYLGNEVSYSVSEAKILDELKSVSGNEENHELVVGDVIRFSLDNDNEIDNIELLYERESGAVYEETALRQQTKYRKKKVSVYDESEGILWVTKEPLSSSGISLGFNDIEAIRATLYTIYVYKEENGKKIVRNGSLADIIDYNSDDTNYSAIYLYDQAGDPSRGVIVVYK